MKSHHPKLLAGATLVPPLFGETMKLSILMNRLNCTMVTYCTSNMVHPLGTFLMIHPERDPRLSIRLSHPMNTWLGYMSWIRMGPNLVLMKWPFLLTTFVPIPRILPSRLRISFIQKKGLISRFVARSANCWIALMEWLSYVLFCSLIIGVPLKFPKTFKDWSWKQSTLTMRKARGSLEGCWKPSPQSNGFSILSFLRLMVSVVGLSWPSGVTVQKLNFQNLPHKIFKVGLLLPLEKITSGEKSVPSRWKPDPCFLRLTQMFPTTRKFCLGVLKMKIWKKRTSLNNLERLTPGWNLTLGPANRSSVVGKILSLPDDHPFHDLQDHRIPQVHRHALNANNNGIAFCTRAAVSDILSKQPKQPFALVVPVSEKVAWQPPQGSNASQPLELIVQDRLSDATYKRQVILVQKDNQVVVKMPKPGFSATLTEKHEVVLEMFTLLLPKELQAQSNYQHSNLLKSRALDQFPILQRENVNIYGFRKIQDQYQKERVVLQAMCKVTKEARILMLETSGAGDVFVRDYISKGAQPVDTTIIPKFWPTDRQGKDEALRSSATIDGFSGIVVTRRGIATRAWCDRVSNVRKVLLASDERICELNQAVVPHHMYNSTGWPLSIGPNDIVKVVAKTCGLPPIPTRCFKTLGVTSWTLGFQTIPTTLNFTAQFNGVIHEILLTKVEDVPLNKKQGKSIPKPSFPKPSSGSNDPVVVSQSNASDERLTSLETKVAAIERRQDGMEQKLQTGFDGIQDQLRQVLNAVQPRPVSPRATGFTPPSKIVKWKPSWWWSRTSPLGCIVALTSLLQFCYRPQFCCAMCRYIHNVAWLLALLVFLGSPIEYISYSANCTHHCIEHSLCCFGLDTFDNHNARQCDGIIVFFWVFARLGRLQSHICCNTLELCQSSRRVWPLALFAIVSIRFCQLQPHICCNITSLESFRRVWPCVLNVDSLESNINFLMLNFLIFDHAFSAYASWLLHI